MDAPRADLAWTLRHTPVLIALAGAALLTGLVLARARKFVFAFCLASAGFVLAGNIAARLFEFRFPPPHIRHLENLGIDLQDPVRISGRIVSSPLESESGMQFDMEISEIEDQGRAIPLKGMLRVRLQRGEDAPSVAHARALQLRYGDSIRALVLLQKPTAYRDPGVFDFRRWLASIHDIYWVGTIKNSALVEKLPPRSSWRLDELRVRVRDAFLGAIDRLYPPWSREGRCGSVLKAVLLGDRSALDSSTIENFRIAGLYHLLVIAGLHVGLLAMLASWVLRFTPLRESSRSVLVLAFLLAYCSLVEQRAPTTRATIMIAVYLVARFFYREHAGLNSVGLAALILLVARPPWLFESGFQFSFAAALLIVGLIAPALARSDSLRRALRNVSDDRVDLYLEPREAQWRLDVRLAAGWLGKRIAILGRHPAGTAAALAGAFRGALWAKDMIIFTAILQMGLMLPMAAIFHRVTFAGIGLNALAIPVMTVLLAVAVPTVLLGAMWPAAAVWPAKALAQVMRLLFFLTDLPHLPAWLSYRVPTPSAWVGWGFAVSLIVAAWSFGRMRWLFRSAALCALVLAALISIGPFSPRIQAGQLEITALDCGAGDSFLVVLPDKTTMLIDAGDRAGGAIDDPFQSRRWDAGEDVVSPYLWSRQIKRLDIVVMTRGAEGELPGFAAMVRNFRIGEWWSASSGLTPKALEFLDELGRRRIRVREIKGGDLFLRGSTTIQVLWPSAAASDAPVAYSSPGPICLRIQDGEASVLFAKDPLRTMELLMPGTSTLLRSNVVALAGGGSPATASGEFLASVSPQVVILSGDRTTRNYRCSSFEGGSPVPGLFRVERAGAVTVEMRGRAITVKSYGIDAGEGTVGRGSTRSLTSSSFSVR